VGSCEHDNEPTDSLKGGKFLEPMGIWGISVG
jgi:hypothetical protein